MHAVVPQAHPTSQAASSYWKLTEEEIIVAGPPPGHTLANLQAMRVAACRVLGLQQETGDIVEVQPTGEGGPSAGEDVPQIGTDEAGRHELAGDGGGRPVHEGVSRDDAYATLEAPLEVAPVTAPEHPRGAVQRQTRQRRSGVATSLTPTTEGAAAAALDDDEVGTQGSAVT